MTDLRDQLQASLGAAYTLERELGGGGMSRVFVATDTALGRHVVVKVLPPEMAAAVSTERFRREISVAARLQHPHIVPLLSAGQMDGIPYFTMPLIEGESLRVRLARKGELPVSEAIRILREIASALAYAHERGVVHRDIKPDNVMMSGDVAMVTDFGVAKALSASSNADHGGVTSLGVALGTPAYMSPEQATADPTIDHRSDIYAFGVLAYEILSGQPPFVGRNPSQLLAAQVQESPDAIARRRPNLPPALAALVMRCLEKRPADRPQSAADIVHALDDITTPSGGMQPTSAGLRAALPVSAGSGASAPRSGLRSAPGPLVLGIVVLALGIGAFLVWRRGPVAGEAEAGPKRVAVLPFENLGDTSEAYFADGITDEIRGKLASLPSMQVTASGSASQYRGSAKTPQEIGKELGVEYLLVGKIRWVKNPGGKSRVRVSPELVQVANVSSPTTRWQQPFDAEITDVFQVQGEIAGQVASALGVALGAGDQKHLSERPTENLAAYDAYLKAEGITGQMTSNDPPTLRRAIESYEQAVALDTSFAPAWAQLSRALSSLYANGTPSPDLASGALRAAQHAVAVAPNRPEGRLATAEYFRLVGKDARRAADEAEQGGRLAPANVDLMVATALAKQESGSWDESQALLEKAFALDPRSVQTAYRLARTLLYRRRYSEALPASDRVLALSPTNLSAIEGKAMSYLGQGNLAAARNVLHAEGQKVEPTALVAYVSTYYDLYWLLDEAQRTLLLRLTPSAFDNDRASWGLAISGAYDLQGDAARARAYADSARAALEEQSAANPADGQLHALMGTALAYLGRRADAIREAERGVTLVPIASSSFNGPYMLHQHARTYLLLGDKDKALDDLEKLLKIPYFISPAWLRIDPNFASLKGNPRFEKLVAGS